MIILTFQVGNLEYVTLLRSDNEDEIGKNMIEEGLVCMEPRREKRLQKLIAQYTKAQEQAKAQRVRCLIVMFFTIIFLKQISLSSVLLTVFNHFILPYYLGLVKVHLIRFILYLLKITKNVTTTGLLLKKIYMSNAEMQNFIFKEFSACHFTLNTRTSFSF